MSKKVLTHEQLDNRSDRRAYTAFSVLILSGVGMIAAAVNHDEAPQTAFIESYIKDGKCLSGTPFDITETAHYFDTETDNEEILSVVPQAANSYKPSTINFAVDRVGILGLRATLYPSDQASEAFIDTACK